MEEKYNDLGDNMEEFMKEHWVLVYGLLMYGLGMMTQYARDGIKTEIKRLKK